MSRETTQLEYEPRKKSRSRQWWNRIVLTGVAGIVAFLAVTRGPAVWWQIRLLYWQWRSEDFSQPPNHVVLDFDLRRNVFYSSAAVSAPDNYRHFLYNGASSLVVFSHLLRSASGQERIVGVDFYPRSGGGLQMVYVSALQLGNIVGAPVDTNQLCAGQSLPPFEKRLIVYAGQPDLRDHSHFTIDLDADDQRLHIDGWLRDDGTVLFESRPPVPIPTPTSSPASSQ
jgi:hypothetical protein